MVPRLKCLSPKFFAGLALAVFIVLLVVTLNSTYVWKNLNIQYSRVPFMDILGYNKTKTEGRVTRKKCVHPELNPYDPLIMQYFSKITPINCNGTMKDWVYTSNGVFHISRDAIRLHGNITCMFETVHRVGDFRTRYGKRVRNITDGMPLITDFFRANCTSTSGRNYSNVHAGVVKKPEIMKRLTDYHSKANKMRNAGSLPQSLSHLNLSIFVFGFDSLSHMGWIRFLPETRKHFINNMGGIEMESFNIVGDGTIAAMLPILTGQTEEELPESRRGHKTAKPLDKHPWIWKDFARRGYVTAYSEDMPRGGTFQWRMLGYKNQPTDHYMRPFHIAAYPTYSKYKYYCLGSHKRHVLFMNYFRDLFAAYKDFPKFLFGFHAEISHETRNLLLSVDNDMKLFLQDLEAKGYLNSTLLILLSDHGARYSAVRSTDIGKLEERLPYVGFRFPPWVHKHYPHIIKNVRTNAKRLTTPFDIYATFRDILNHTDVTSGALHNRSISLFQEVPQERSCADADVAPHWCACIEWERLNKTDPLVVLAVNTAVQALNEYTQPQREHCALLKLKEITKGVRHMSKKNWKVFKFVNKPLPKHAQLYQVSFRTLPGNGHFEVTCAVVAQEKKVIVDAKEISRINAYGSQPACIAKQFPYLRRYCYCVK